MIDDDMKVHAPNCKNGICFYNFQQDVLKRIPCPVFHKMIENSPLE